MSPEVEKDSKALGYYKDLKELIEIASMKINASLRYSDGDEGVDS